MSDDCCGDEGPYYFDESGELVADGTVPVGDEQPFPEPPPDRLQPVRPLIGAAPCSLSVANGSWLVALTPRRRVPVLTHQLVRGPMRIQVQESSLRVSGDIYVRRTLVLDPRLDEEYAVPAAPPEEADVAEQEPADAAEDLLISPVGRNGAPRVASYPQLPKNEYSWYFRSTGASYRNGVLTFGLVRHLWDRTSQDFVATDTGTMSLTCRRSALRPVLSPATMEGIATVGGATYDVRATKTANLYRGCTVEVDVMTGRTWPARALNRGMRRTFRGVYASTGWDTRVTVDELGVPEDASLTMAELQTLLSTHRGPVDRNAWHLWLLVGSRQGTLFGIMFDDDSVPREGAVGFADATLGGQSFIEAAARNQPLNAVPAAFLRTLIHEAGHAFNLFHPKHDVHSPPIGTEIMNQTGDVMSFASALDPYPGNATFGFATHDRDSLVHSPDPQVRPGWKNFGWGHGSLSSGLPTPVDAGGLLSGDDAEGVTLEVTVPTEVFVGEYVTAEVRLTNTGPDPREITGRLNLAEGYLRFQHILPNGAMDQVRDIVVACGPRDATLLRAGESLTARMQLFFTSGGITFAQPGTHVLRAEFDVDMFTTVRSRRCTVYVRTAATQTEADISAQTMDSEVGRAFALGDFGTCESARRRLVAVAEAHHGVDTGAAAALVMANSTARPHTDYAADQTRDTAPEESQHFLDLAMQGRTAQEITYLAVTVASPVEPEAPVVADSLARAKRARKAKADMAEAESIIADFVATSPS